MEKIYNPKHFEKEIQKYWEINETFKVIENPHKEKYYCLAMLPYPSGKLHMGHVRNYTISDVLARYHRMIGKNVLHPIGWDAFGLPAEEASIKNGSIPSKWTTENIQYMKKQLKKLGLSYDWSREITTCDPNYYKWEQWLFNKLYDKKLVYKKNALVNWCPKDQTVLANEQVVKGQCWRCQSNIIIKMIPQWFIKITNYAPRLLTDLQLLQGWPKKVLKMQKNWIGKSRTFQITCKIYKTNQTIKINIKRLDLLMGIKYISISPLHFLAQNELTEHEKKFFLKNMYTANHYRNKNFAIKYIGKKILQYVVHPITNKKIPIWITNYTEIENNYKIKMSIPAHNKHDWNFAKKYHIPITYVILPTDNSSIETIDYPIEEFGILHNSKEFNGLSSAQAIKKIFAFLMKQKIIEKKNIYRLQDWSVSRQRYWGTPIPIAYTKNKKIIPIPNNKLPVILPKINNIHELKNIDKIYEKWSQIFINNQPAVRETDTFDTFLESSWYYIKYTAPNFQKSMVNKKTANYWLPIDQYIGGIEHATMHLIYFRFFHKLLYDLKLVNTLEPAIKLLCQGMVLADAFYYIAPSGKKIWVNANQVTKKTDHNEKNSKYFIKNKQLVNYAGMIKMSKSKNNGVDPETMIKKYGADTIRLFIMFAAPATSDIVWSEAGVKGMYRFLQRIWTLVYNYTHNINNATSTSYLKIQEINKIIHQTIYKVSKNISKNQSFNTAISEIMKLTNIIYNLSFQQYKKLKFIKNTLNIILKMLYPFTPHIIFKLWNILNNNKHIDQESWPEYEKKYIIQNNTQLIVQINGKKKYIITVKTNTSQEEICNLLKKNINIVKILNNKTIKKIIHIPNKVINFVT